LLDEALSHSGSEERVAHLVLKADWPIALCGANVSEHLGTGASALDRCVDCLRIAATRGLGRPGWESRA
jgi:crotonobetainyl-CoA:carnitine CoA-transferase CaiB-like acyl-CoA transferase